MGNDGYAGTSSVSDQSIAMLLICGMDDANKQQRIDELIDEMGDPNQLKRRLLEAMTVPVSVAEAMKWFNRPCRRCPACLAVNPAACTRCLNCHVVYQIKVTRANRATQEQPDRDEIKEPTLQLFPWDIDDEVPIPNDFYHRYKYIYPTKEERKANTQPKCDLSIMRGKRNLID